jgi:precorrin-3B C17-methyltransferase
MTQEVERAHQCIDLAKSGKIVSLVSSGDPGIYGMAGLIYETLAESGWNPKDGLHVEIIPGVSALNSCASIVGSPLMTDFAVVSMSDLLVPWEIIEKRVEAAAQGDFVIVIYNPASKKRIHQLEKTRQILLKYRKSTTPVAIIKGAFRESETIVMTDLDDLPNHSDTLGMISTVIIGNSSTYTYKDLMINPRGYKSKYNLEEQTNPDLKV